MNYPSNTITHEIGALVLHDCDAKRRSTGRNLTKPEKEKLKNHPMKELVQAEQKRITDRLWG